MSTLYPFENIGRDNFAFLRARSDIDGLHYTVSQTGKNRDSWAASRYADHLIQVLAGGFHFRRFKTMGEAIEACEDDFKLVDRVSQWIEHIRTCDPPPPAWKLR